MFLDERIDAVNVMEYRKYIPENDVKRVWKGDVNAGAVYDVVGEEKRFFGLYVSDLFDGWIGMTTLALADEDERSVEKGRFIRHCILHDKKRRGGKLKGAFLELDCEEAWPDAFFAISLSGMEPRTGKGNTYEFALSDVKNRAMLKKAAAKQRCIPLSDADDELLEKLRQKMREDERPVPMPSQEDWARYLPEVSCLCMKGRTPAGALLINRTEDALVVDLAYSANNMALPALLYYSLIAAEKSFGEEQHIIVPVVVNRTAALVERMVPGAKRGEIISAVIRF